MFGSAQRCTRKIENDTYHATKMSGWKTKRSAVRQVTDGNGTPNVLNSKIPAKLCLPERSRIISGPNFAVSLELSNFREKNISCGDLDQHVL